MIAIPANDNIQHEEEELDRVIETALEALARNGECWINSNANGYNHGNCCGEHTADRVARAFLNKGYHVRKNYNIVGRWMSYTISKRELTAGNHSEILG